MSDVRAFTDTAFPLLGTLADRDAALGFIESSMPDFRERLQLLGGELANFHYRHGTRCVAHYRLEFRDRKDGRLGQQLVTVHLVQPDETYPEVPQEQLDRYQSQFLPHRAKTQAVLSTPVAYVADSRALIFAYPIDRVFSSLLELVDRAAMKRKLRRICVEKGRIARDVTIERLGYVPEMRAAFRYDIVDEDRATGARGRQSLIGKVHARRHPAMLFADSWALRRAADGRLSLPRPVGYLSSLGLVLQESVDGERLSNLMAATSVQDNLRLTATAIADLHAISAPLSVRRSAAGDARAVQRLANSLATICPQLAGPIGRLRDDLAAEIEARATISGLIHGDFHPGNVLVDGDRVTLIDLDNIGYGDPAADIGRFLASLRTRSLRAFGTHTALSEAGEAFLQAYLARVSLDVRRVRLYEAAWLLHVANYFFEVQVADLDARVSAIVDEVERIAGLAADVSAPAGHDKDDKALAAFDDRISLAGDSDYIAASLAAYVWQKKACEVEACEISHVSVVDDLYRARYRVRCRAGRKRAKFTFTGLMWRDLQSRGVLRRSRALERALGGRAGAPQFPRVVEHLRPLSMLVFDFPEGMPLSTAIKSEDALAVADGLATALSVLHASRGSIGGRRSFKTRLASLRERVEALSSQDHDLADRAGEQLLRVERSAGRVPERNQPTIGNVRIDQILVRDGAIAIAAVDQVRLSHPLSDVGSILARLTLLAWDEDSPDDIAAFAQRFRQSYLVPSQENADELAMFEAAGVLSLACIEAQRGGPQALVEFMLTRAEEILSPRSTVVNRLADAGRHSEGRRDLSTVE
jgi:aminoglycoside phosphotransferase (APT) family kinase protein